VKSETPPLWKTFCWTTAGTILLLPAFVHFLAIEAKRKVDDWDQSVSMFLHRPFRAARFITRLGDGWLYALVFLWLREHGDKAAASRISSFIFLAWSICAALKFIIRRKRRHDYDFKRELRFIRGHATTRRTVITWNSWSFPSQHAACATAFACALWPNPGAILLALAICVSRVLTGAHYLGDVLAGVALGIVAGRLA
jgi:membrane-associated phospholipid phosphatase